MHVTYLTAWVNKDGAVNFRRDPYKRDDQLAQVLTGVIADDGPLAVSSR